MHSPDEAAKEQLIHLRQSWGPSARQHHWSWTLPASLKDCPPSREMLMNTDSLEPGSVLTSSPKMRSWVLILIPPASAAFSGARALKSDRLGPNPPSATFQLLIIHCGCCLVTKSCPTLCDPMDSRPPGSFCPWDFPRQEYWSVLPFPSPGDLTNSGIELASPALTGRFFTTGPLGKPHVKY